MQLARCVHTTFTHESVASDSDRSRTSANTLKKKHHCSAALGATQDTLFGDEQSPCDKSITARPPSPPPTRCAPKQTPDTSEGTRTRQALPGSAVRGEELRPDPHQRGVGTIATDHRGAGQAGARNFPQGRALRRTGRRQERGGKGARGRELFSRERGAGGGGGGGAPRGEGGRGHGGLGPVLVRQCGNGGHPFEVSAHSLAMM